RTLQGQGKPPSVLPWNGETDDGHLIEGGQIYQYQVDLRYRDDSRCSSPRRLFGVNRRAAISLSLSGGAFRAGSDELSEKARKVLTKAAEALRKFPKETIVVEGHTDATGTKELNTELSRK